MAVNTSRRSFLRTTTVSASAFILGLPLLERAAFGRGPGNLKVPAIAGVARTDENLVELFQERMKKEHKPGLVIVIPDDKAKAIQLSDGLTVTFQTGDLAIFTQGVFACLPPEKAEKFTKELAGEICLIPIDVEGKVGKPVALDPAKFADEFRSRCRELLLGEKDERIPEIVKAQEKGLGQEKVEHLHKAIAELNDDSYAKRTAAAAVVAELAPRMPAMVYQEFLNSRSAEARRHLSSALMTMTECPKENKVDALLPFGVKWLDLQEPCIACSRSSTSPNVRRYLQFVLGK